MRPGSRHLLAVCPWSRPGLADNLLAKMARRRNSRCAACRISNPSA
jgi:hypothetical protein